jgi:acyl-homoserine lactone acylase PvdQ
VIRRLVLACALLLAAAPPATAQKDIEPGFIASIDDAQLHGTVTPPGSDSRHATTEVAAYDDLVQGYPALTDQELRDRYFKTRIFGPIADVDRTYQPRGDVTVTRDAQWGEPHIFGQTDEAMAFGAGYVTAEDRLAIMELLRALGRGEAFELLGTAPAWLADAEVVRLYGYTDEEFEGMATRLPEVYGRNGEDFLKILDGYVAGINAYKAEAARGEVPAPAGVSDFATTPGDWRRGDVVAAVSTVRALFGAGGGSEMNDAAVMAGLVRDLGAKLGPQVYEDFRNRDNRDGPLHTRKRFPYLQVPARIDPKANAVEPTAAASKAGASARAAELERLAQASRIRWERLKLSSPGAALDLSRNGAMSNHLVIGARRTKSGFPLLIGGPQAGYFSPQILMDYELHSPTIHARGAGFPGLSAIVVMGRTQRYAWTPTAGGADMIDTYVDVLCEPGGGAATEDSDFYMFKGKCEAMDRRTVREAPPGTPYPDIVAERTVHGPVLARGMLDGKPVAVVNKRSTFLKELDAAISILRMNRGEATTANRFISIFAESHNLSTNWSYASRREIGYAHGGLYPIRPPGPHPDFPKWGTGEWEWKTDAKGDDVYLGRDQVPHEANPKRGFTFSWNNSQAPGWAAADGQWGHGSIHRGKLLEDQILAQKPHSITPVRLVQMMEKAGLTDLRGRYVAPLALRVLSKAQLGPRERVMVALLKEWITEGALRRDGDGDGDYDRSAAVAIMDAWWQNLLRGIFDPVLGDSARIPITFDNAPNSGGSAYESGFYPHVYTDLSMVLARRLKSPTSRIYCGGSKDASGRLAGCAKVVLASLVAAGDALRDSQDSDDPAAWKSDAAAERILFLPAAALSMHWVNRPTTQQIAMFGRLPLRPKLSLRVRCVAGRARAGVRGPDRARVRRVRFTYGRRLVRARVTMRSGQPRSVRLKRRLRPCGGPS